MKQQVYLGEGKINELKKILRKIKPKMIFLVTEKESFIASGAQKIIGPILRDYLVDYFSNFQVNPRIQDIKKGIEKHCKTKADLIIAVGGGSSIDMAKAINILSAQKDRPEKYFKKGEEATQPGRKLVAIPTTAGSGSQATQFAVIYQNNVKYSLDHDYILPDIAIVDPIFLKKVPRKIAASCAMDALAQAIESYWSVRSSAKSKKFASRAIKLIVPNLPQGINQPTNKTRLAMAEAAQLAGQAINISRTTLPHALSYYLTAYYGIPHGQAVAMTLGETFVFNSQVNKFDINDKRGVDYCQEIMRELCKMFQVKNSQEARKKIMAIMREIGLETELSSFGVRKGEIEKIIEGINLQRANNNPRKISVASLRKILNNVY